MQMKKNFDAAIHAYIRASLCVFEAPLEAKKKLAVMNIAAFLRQAFVVM